MSSAPPPPRPNTPPQLLALASLLGRGAHDMELPVHSDAMAPVIPADALVRVRTGKGAPRQRGTVIAYVSGRGMVAARVVWRGVGPRARRYVLPRGDACLLCDPPIPAGALVGAVVALSSGGEWLPLPEGPELSTAVTALRALLALPLVVALEIHEWPARVLARAMLLAARVVAVVVRRPMHRW